jgi:hypothetical protein
VCGRNLITGLTFAASPRVDISNTCRLGQKLGLSLPLLTCSASAWPSRLLYRRGRKSRTDLRITLYLSTSSHKRHDFRKKKILGIKCVFRFPLKICLKYFSLWITLYVPLLSAFRCSSITRMLAVHMDVCLICASNIYNALRK